MPVADAVPGGKRVSMLLLLVRVLSCPVWEQETCQIRLSLVASTDAQAELPETSAGQARRMTLILQVAPQKACCNAA